MITFYIKEIREKNNLTQKQLAKLSKVSDSQISYIERGERQPTLLVMCKIAKALKVDINELYKYEE